MEKKITLDRKTFKALAADTRIEILKKLDERQQTLSDLAEEFDMAPSTIKEHLDKLVEVGLIRQIDKGMKWKYYKLTRKGKKLVNPYETKVWIILASALVGLFASLYNLLFNLGKLTQRPFSVMMEHAPQETYEVARREGVQKLSEDITANMTTTPLPPPAMGISQVSIPYLELTLVIILVLILGICVGYLIKKRRIL